jgi:hypothetical protein
MMATIAYVDSNFTEFSFEYWKAATTFHIIRRFVKVTDAWNMSFLLRTKNISMIIDDNSGVVQCSTYFVPFQD